MKTIPLNRIKKRLLLMIFKNNPIVTGHMRAKLYRRFGLLKIEKNCFIGKNVHFDDIHIDRIKIGRNVMITQNSSFLTHFYDIKYSKQTGVHEFYEGDVVIEDNVFIGMNSVIVKPLTIYKGAIIGAGVVLSRDVPKNSIVTNINITKTITM